MVKGFQAVLEAMNNSTNLLAVVLIGGGLLAVLKGHDAAGGSLVTGGFTLLNNSVKRFLGADPAQPAPQEKPNA